MSGAFGVGINLSDDDRGFAEWSRRHFKMMAIGGVWGVPRSGLVFTRTSERTLALTEVMPYDPAMPITPGQLHEQQAGEYEAIRKYMEAGGVSTSDATGTFE